MIFLRSAFLKNDGLGDIQSGGSVATSLYDLLRQMQFDHLYLFGQDLAYSYREIHCPGTHHTFQWLAKNIQKTVTLEQINLAVLKKREVKTELGHGGSLVGADYVLSLYKHWFEQAQERLSCKFQIAPLRESASMDMQRLLHQPYQPLLIGSCRQKISSGQTSFRSKYQIS